jgi:DNA-binding transcriptional MocR family regulator
MPKVNIRGKTSAEISDSIRELVQQGALAPGDILPPMRELADILGVNRNTVAAAYQRLVQAGIAITQGRLGTTICAPADSGEQEGASTGTALIDVAHGNPNEDWIPDPAALLAANPPKRFLYGEDTVLPEIRALADEWFARDCPPDWTFELTHGAVDAIERLATAHLAPGDKVAVEDPCYLGSINTLRLAGMRPSGVEVDESGMQPAALEAALQAGARAVLITPRAHNPTGCSLTRRRADALKRVLAAHPNVLVIVDDHLSLLAETPYYSVIPPSTLHWAVIRSLSKSMGPDLRMALVACNPDTGERLRSRLAPGKSWVSHILQAIVVAGLRSKAVMEQLAAARDDYAARRNLLRNALMELGVNVPVPGGGFNLWVPMPKDAREVAYDLAKRGWLVRHGNAFDVQRESRALRITVSKLTDKLILQLAQDIKACL